MMRSLLLFFLILLPVPCLALPDYQLDLQLYPAEHKLLGTATIQFEKVASPLQLELMDTCQIITIYQTGQELAYHFENGQLAIQLLNQEPVSISYMGHFTDQLSQQPGHNEDPSYGISASISDRGTYLSGGVAWYPRLADISGNFLVSVHTPEGILAVTSGERLRQEQDSRQSLSVWRIDYPMRGLTLVAGAYQVFTDNNGDVPIYAYFYAESVSLAQEYLQQSRSYLKLYQELFGPYPFHKFAIVENFFPTGYGLPSWTLLGSSVIKLPFIVKTSLGHEIAHSWWGTGVRVDYRQGNWCEGLTTYVADYLYKERGSELEALDYRRNILRDYASLITPGNVLPLNQFRSRYNKVSQVIGYGKAAMIFHMLRQQVGDQIFWEGLRRIAAERMFQEIGWDEFERVYNQLSGQPLGPFFNQWLSRTLGPELYLRDINVKKSGYTWELSGKIVQLPPAYRLNLGLRITTEQGVENHLLQFQDLEQAFSYTLTARPLSLVADPDYQVFRILAPEEIPSILNSIRGSERLLILQGSSANPSAAAQQILLGGMRLGEESVRSATTVNPKELPSHDLLIFGTTPQLKPEQLRQDSIHIADKDLQLANGSALIVTRNPYNSQRHAAWFLSQENGADKIAARKIPHYGKYSYLWFSDGNNQLKGVWEAERSPLRIDFAPAVNR